MSLTKRHTSKAGLGPSPAVTPMSQACRADVSTLRVCSHYFLGKRLPRLTVTHISNLTKLIKVYYYYSLASPRRNGPGPGPGATRSPPWLRARGEDCYFHKGLYNLSGPGPEYMIVKLGLAL